MDLEAYKQEGIIARKNIDDNLIRKIAGGIVNSFNKNGKLENIVQEMMLKVYFYNEYSKLREGN